MFSDMSSMHHLELEKFEFWSYYFNHVSLISHYLIQCTRFHHNQITLIEISWYNNFYIVAVRHLGFVMTDNTASDNWLHSPNKFHVDLFCSFCTSVTCARLATDRQVTNKTAKIVLVQYWTWMPWLQAQYNKNSNISIKCWYNMTNVCFRHTSREHIYWCTHRLNKKAKHPKISKKINTNNTVIQMARILNQAKCSTI